MSVQFRIQSDAIYFTGANTHYEQAQLTDFFLLLLKKVTISLRALAYSREERHSLEGVRVQLGEARGPEK